MEKNKLRATEIALRELEERIANLELTPGSPVAEAEIAAALGLGRTPVREALMRLIGSGLVVTQPRRGLVISSIDVGEHLDVLRTRRVLEQLIAVCSTQRATPVQHEQLVGWAHAMLEAAKKQDLAAYMHADQELDRVNHAASRNNSAVQSVRPLIIQCRRFWYAYQHRGDMVKAARAHLSLAEGIAAGDEARAIAGADQLMDYLDRFASKVIGF